MKVRPHPHPPFLPKVMRPKDQFALFIQNFVLTVFVWSLYYCMTALHCIPPDIQTRSLTKSKFCCCCCCVFVRQNCLMMYPGQDKFIINWTLTPCQHHSIVSGSGHKNNNCHAHTNHSSGAVWESRWPSWAVRPNKPSGFRGHKAILNHALALVSACP